MSTDNLIIEANIATMVGDGFSFNLGGNAPVSGYMVALEDHEYIVEQGDSIAQAIEAYVVSNVGPLSSSDALYFGGWFNDGRLYLDLSENVQDVRKAKILGAQRHQIAIWDVVNSREIVL